MNILFQAARRKRPQYKGHEALGGLRGLCGFVVDQRRDQAVRMASSLEPSSTTAWAAASRAMGTR